MNELLNYLNNYAKNRKNKQRFSAIMVCLAIIVSFTVSVGLIEPAESASGELICGMEEHEHTQDCFELICGFDEETEEEIVVETTVSDSEETTESSTLTVETATADTEPATTDTETIISTCTDESVPAPVHIHNDECYRLICLTEAHLHKKECYNQPAETEPAATEIFTSTSTSTSTGTTTTTEQTTETTTTATELSEEVYELTPDTFGELYMDRVNILADETEEAGYKFYYTGGEANQLYAHDYFTYHNTATGEPSKNIVRTYNGNTYSYAYNFNGVNSNRYVSVKTESNGVLILIFGDGDNFKVKVLNEATNQSTEKEFKSGDDGIMVVPVVQGVNYKVTQSGGATNARLVYAEFVPTVEPKNGGNYRIRNVKTGLYVEVEDANKNNGSKIKTGQYSYDDKKNDFKFIAEGEYFNIYPQLDYSNNKDGVQMIDLDRTNNIIQTYSSSSNSNMPYRQFRFVKNDTNGTYKIYTRYDTLNKQSDDTCCWEVSENGTIVNATINTTNLSQDFIFVEKVVTIDTNRTYAIQNSGSKKFLSYGDADITQVDSGKYSESDNNLKFKFEDAGDGYYYIKVLAKGLETNYLEAYYNNDSKDLKIAAKDESNNNQKFKIIDNLDGTYKIRCEGGVIDANPGSGVSAYYDYPSNKNQKFIIAETEPPTVGSPAVISPDTTFLIRNVRSRLYIHREENAPVYQKNSDGDIAYDNKNKPIVESYLTNQAIQHEDNDYIEEETKFKFVSTGKQGEYYIKSVNGDVALSMDNIANGAANIKYEAFNENDDNQKFRAEILDNGSYCFYRIVDGVRYYVGIPYTSVMDGMIIDARPSENVSDNLTFFLVPFVENPNVEENRTRVEARVIFADYNDGKFDLYKYADDKVKNGEKKAGDVKTDERNLYDEPAYRPVLELNGNTTVNADYVVDVSDARKDWCYQYNYVWDLDSGTTNTVKLNGVNNDHQITLNGKVFNVYYLKDTELGHPGNNGESNAPADAYKQTPYSLTGDQIIYIFLDPVVEKWWGGTTEPRTIDLSMKKRWDGYNEGYGFRNRPKEKIKIQLQHLVNGKWVKFDSNEYMNEYYYEVTDDKGNRHMVNIDKIGTKSVYYKKGEYYTDENCTNKWNKVTYDDLKGTADALDPQKEKRLIVKMVSSEDWNDIVLTVGGENNPQHFTNGYYYNWKAIPYGQYRVIETQSFYDANDNNVFDEGDRDTSQEYYYMSYPPMRDSRGVLHIQNFTKDMVIEVQKKWQDDEGGDLTPNKPIKFEVYRCLGDPRNSVPENLEPVGKFTTNENGYAFITSREKVSGEPETSEYYYNVDNMETKNGDTKYHYFIKEIVPDGYKLINGNEKGYVLKNGSTTDYSVDYEDGDGRKFIITNKAKIGLRVEKEWYYKSVSDENKIDYYNNNTDNPIYPKFRIYKGDRPGTPEKNSGSGYSVNGSDLTLLKNGTEDEFQIGSDGYFELVSDANDVHGDSSNVNNKLNMLSDTKIALTLETDIKGNYLRFGNPPPTTVNGIISFKEDNIMWFGSKNKIQPYISGTLTFVIADFNEANYTDSARIEICEKTFNSNNQDTVSYKIKGSGGKINIPNVYIDGNCRVQCKECDITINNVYFTNNAYYYIQEIKEDNYTLSNGDSNGFVKIGDNFYTTITANNHYPVVTVQNIPKVNLDITKEWYADADMEKQLEGIYDKSMKFKIYKAFAQGTPKEITIDNTASCYLESGNTTCSLIEYTDDIKVKNDSTTTATVSRLNEYYTTPADGKLSIIELPAYDSVTENDKTIYKKVYYYIQEADGNFKLLKGNDCGFVQNGGNTYGTSFEDNGNYIFQNQPTIDLTVNKIWKDANEKVIDNKVDGQIKFELYQTTNESPDPSKDTKIVNIGDKTATNGLFETKNYTITFENLPAYDLNGNLYRYYIKEETSTISATHKTTYNGEADFTEVVIVWNKYGAAPKIEIVNKEIPISYELPETGGSGTHGCTAAGGAIVLLSAAVLLLKRRKKIV